MILLSMLLAPKRQDATPHGVLHYSPCFIPPGIPRAWRSAVFRPRYPCGLRRGATKMATVRVSRVPGIPPYYLVPGIPGYPPKERAQKRVKIYLGNDGT